MWAMTQHRTGPVRSDAARLAVLDATAELFEEVGYDRLTIEGMAARAQVAKQTVYRWWPSKGAVVADCLFEGLILRRALTPLDTGDLIADFRTWIGSIFELLEQPRGEDLLRSLIAAAAEHPEVGRRFREALSAESAFTDRLRNAVKAGQLPAETPLRDLNEAIVGIVVIRALSRDPIDPAAAERLLEAMVGASHSLFGADAE